MHTKREERHIKINYFKLYVFKRIISIEAAGRGNNDGSDRERARRTHAVMNINGLQAAQSALFAQWLPIIIWHINNNINNIQKKTPLSINKRENTQIQYHDSYGPHSQNECETDTQKSVCL